MQRKTLIALLAFAALFASSIYQFMENRQLEQELALAMGFQSQLQEAAENTARQRLQYDEQIALLNRQLASSAYQLSNLSNALQETRLQVDPDYEDLLQRARDEVAQQNMQRTARPNRGPLSAFSDPDSALAMAQENMPRMYDSFLNSLGIPGTERQLLMNDMLDFGAQRYQMLAELIDGTLSVDQATSWFGADALSQNMAMSLTAQQQEDLRQYDLLLKQDTLREVYQEALARTGSALEGMARDQVIAALLDEIVSEQNNWGALVADDGSMLSAHRDRVAAFDRARERVAPQLSEPQREQLDRFIETQSDGVDVILEASTDNRGRVAITQARIGVEDLPR